MKIGKQSAARTSTGGAKNPSELGLKKTSKEGGWDGSGTKRREKESRSNFFGQLLAISRTFQDL